MFQDGQGAAGRDEDHCRRRDRHDRAAREDAAWGLAERRDRVLGVGAGHAPQADRGRDPSTADIATATTVKT